MLFHGFAELFGDAIGQTTDLHRFLKASPFGNHIANFGKGAESGSGRHLGFGRTVINEERFGDGMTGIGYGNDDANDRIVGSKDLFPWVEIDHVTFQLPSIGGNRGGTGPYLGREFGVFHFFKDSSRQVGFQVGQFLFGLIFVVRGQNGNSLRIFLFGVGDGGRVDFYREDVNLGRHLGRPDDRARSGGLSGFDGFVSCGCGQATQEERQ